MPYVFGAGLFTSHVLGSPVPVELLDAPDRQSVGVKDGRAGDTVGGSRLALLLQPTLMFQTADFFCDCKADEVVQGDAIMLGELCCLLARRRAKP